MRYKQVSSGFLQVRLSLLSSSLIVGSLLLFSSCIPEMKIDQWVGEHYKASFPPKAIASNPAVTIDNTFDIKDTSKASITNKWEAKTTPLVVYSKWHFLNVCQISENIAASKFNTAIQYYSSKKPLKDKLIGHTLELTINTIPHGFYHDDKGSAFLFFGSEDLYVKPDKKNLVVDYRYLAGDKVEKKGSITITDINKSYEQTQGGSTKKWTNEYLDQFDDCLVKMSKSFVDKLVSEIQ